MKVSPKVYCPERRQSIIGPPRFRLPLFGSEQLLVQFADLFQSGSQLVVIVETATHLGDLLRRQAELANDAAWISDGENGNGMAFTAGAFGTTGAMADGALEQRAAQDVGGLWEASQEAVAAEDDLLSIHQ